jgi:hypothetical protein
VQRMARVDDARRRWVDVAAETERLLARQHRAFGDAMQNKMARHSAGVSERLAPPGNGAGAAEGQAGAFRVVQKSRYLQQMQSLDVIGLFCCIILFQNKSFGNTGGR